MARSSGTFGRTHREISWLLPSRTGSCRHTPVSRSQILTLRESIQYLPSWSDSCLKLSSSSATSQLGPGHAEAGYTRLRYTSPFRSELIVFHSCPAPGISLYMGSLPFGSEENDERLQFRIRPRSPSSGSWAGSGDRPSTASGVITTFANGAWPLQPQAAFHRVRL